MGFADYWTDDDKPQDAAAGDAPLPADGRHSGTIKVAEIKDLAFKVSDKNPTGKCLVVKVAIKGCRLIEDIIPVIYRGAIEAVCRAARVATTAGPADMIDAEVQVETTLAVSAKGTEYCRTKWLPGPPGVAPKPAPKQARKPAAAKQLDADDIPF